MSAKKRSDRPVKLKYLYFSTCNKYKNIYMEAERYSNAREGETRAAPKLQAPAESVSANWREALLSYKMHHLPSTPSSLPAPSQSLGLGARCAPLFHCFLMYRPIITKEIAASLDVVVCSETVQRRF